MTKLELSSYPDTPAARAELVEFLNRHIPLQNGHGWEQRMIIHSSARIQGTPQDGRTRRVTTALFPGDTSRDTTPAILRRNQHV